MTFGYANILESKSEAQLRDLAHSKRFLERFTGDEAFRTAVLSGDIDLDAAAAACGCMIDVSSLQPIYHPDFVEFRQNATEYDWPLTYLWDMYLREMLGMRHSILQGGSSGGLTPEFDAWRERQIGRVQLELGIAALGLVHPPVSFELSSGCSVGCWFCGISAKEFRGNFSLQEGGAEFWRGVLEATRNVLGDGLQHGFCYWATEPLDNPEYPGFLKIYEEVAGIVPQTTSAIPLRDVALTREVLGLTWQSKFVPNRFSVLSTAILKRIHSAFTPEELLVVELVLQNDGSQLNKSKAGRAYKDDPNASTTPKRSKARAQAMEATIACVSGFLINIQEKRLRLVSPTVPSDLIPDGYVVLDETFFVDPGDLELRLRGMVAKHMSGRMTAGSRLSLGKTFQFIQHRDSTALRSRAVQLDSNLFESVGPALAGGEATALGAALAACRTGRDPFEVVGMIDGLHRFGVIETDLEAVGEPVSA